jgi:3-dehydroquinate dehydratase II
VKILVIHGPNLNLLGSREPEVYGSDTLEDINKQIWQAAEQLGFQVDIRQSQREGEIIEFFHEGIGDADGAVINPGAYSHTSRAIADAIGAVPYPVVEVHLSNIHAREAWRRDSVTAQSAKGVVAGFGGASYVAALVALKSILQEA